MAMAIALFRALDNPLLLEQLLQSIAESAEALLPGSIQSLVLARMDRLDAPDDRAAQAASVLGQHFDLAALQHLIGDATYDCAGLLCHQLARPSSQHSCTTTQRRRQARRARRAPRQRGLTRGCL